MKTSSAPSELSGDRALAGLKLFEIWEHSGYNKKEAVKMGWSWPAFIIPIPYFFYKRMWGLAFLTWFGVGAILVVIEAIDQEVQAGGWLAIGGNLGFGLLFGFLFPQLRTSFLEKHGWKKRDVVQARNRDAALALLLLLTFGTLILPHQAFAWSDECNVAMGYQQGALKAMGVFSSSAAQMVNSREVVNFSCGTHQALAAVVEKGYRALNEACPQEVLDAIASSRRGYEASVAAVRANCDAVLSDKGSN